LKRVNEVCAKKSYSRFDKNYFVILKAYTMKQLFLPAALMILSFSNASTSLSNHSKTHAANTSKFSNALAIVPSDKVEITPQRVEDERDGDEDEPYRVSMSGKNFTGEVTFDENGTLASYDEEIKNTKMPYAVVTAIKEKYPDAVFTKDHEIINDERKHEDTYKVYFDCGKKHGYALVTSDGQIIHSKQ
jgi:hypothetical protein